MAPYKPKSQAFFKTELSKGKANLNRGELDRWSTPSYWVVGFIISIPEIIRDSTFWLHKCIVTTCPINSFITTDIHFPAGIFQLLTIWQTIKIIGYRFIRLGREKLPGHQRYGASTHWIGDHVRMRSHTGVEKGQAFRYRPTLHFIA